MRKLIVFIFSFLAASVAMADGPVFRHKDTFVNQEFDNTYADLRKKVSSPINESSGTITALNVNKIIYNSNVISSFTASGEILQPLQPSFLVTNSAGATDVTGDGTAYTVPWGNEIYDQGNDFASDTFTAPVTGRYLLQASVRLLNILVGATTRSISIVTSNRTYRNTVNMSLAQLAYTPNICVIADMDAGDTATVEVETTNQTKTVDVNANAEYNYFSGSLIN